MPLSQDFSDRPKKKLKFYCTNCGAEIITLYLRPGDTLVCKFCHEETVVPDNAGETGDITTLQRSLRKEKPFGIPGLEIKDTSGLPTPWGTLSILKFIGAYIGGLIIIVIFALIVGAIMDGIFYPETKFGKEVNDVTSKNVAEYITAILEFFLPIALIYYLVVKRHNNKFCKGLHLYKISKTEFYGYSKLAIGILCFVLVTGSVVILTPLNNYVPEDMPIDRYFEGGYGGLLWWTIFGLLAPIREELIFRGYIYKGLANSMRRSLAGIIVTIVFVILHGPQLSFSPVHLFSISIAAVIMIIVRIKTDSLTKCIIIHQIYNTGISLIVWALVLILVLNGYDPFQH